MTWNEARSLDDSLLSLEAFFRSQPQLAELLSGGLTNRCWKITSHSGDNFVWRPVSSVSHAYGISRMKEYRLLESLQECHFSPNPAYLNEKGMLAEWIEGEVQTAFPIGEMELISTLAKIHSVDVHSKPIPLFSFTAKVDGYWHQLKIAGLGKEYEDLYLQYRNLPPVDAVDATLCHLDLGPYNLVMTEEGIKVIDWEYAGVTDPRMDLAMTIEVSGIDMPRAVAMYCKLRDIEDVDVWLKGVNQWLPRIRMMSMLWYLLGYQLWQDEQYLEQADKLKSQF